MFFCFLYLSYTFGPSGYETQLTKKNFKYTTWFSSVFCLPFRCVGFWKALAVVSFFASHSGLGFCKILAVKINPQEWIQNAAEVYRAETCPPQACPTQVVQLFLPNAGKRRMPRQASRRARGDSSLWPRGTSPNCLAVHSLCHPKIQNPKIPKRESKIQNSVQNANFFVRILGILEFRFWISDRYAAVLHVRPPAPQFGFWILDFRYGILFAISLCANFGFWFSDFGFCPTIWGLRKRSVTGHADPGRRMWRF